MTIDDVSVSISVADAKVTQAGFGVPLIIPEVTHAIFTDRTKEYATITAVAVDFASTTLVYKAANALFAQTTKWGKAIEKVKVGRVAAGDANLTATLNNIVAEDNDWYCLILTDRTEAAVLLAAAWIETQAKIMVIGVEDADIITSAVDDLAYVLKAAGYTRTALIWTHEAGVEIAVTSIAVSSEIATGTKVAHTLRVGDVVLIAGATDAGADASVLNGDVTVLTVPTADTWTHAAVGAADGSATGTITAHARFKFPGAAWAGSCLPDNPGAITWKFQTLAGIVAATSAYLDSAERGYAEGKNANIYVTTAGVSHTSEGVMASGRFIDVTRGVDWLDARMEEAVFTQLVTLAKIPYTNAGLAVIESAIRKVLALALERRVISPLSDVDTTTDLDYTLTIPDVADIATASKTARLFPDITFRALVGNAVHGVTITGTLSV